MKEVAPPEGAAVLIWAVVQEMVIHIQKQFSWHGWPSSRKVCLCRNPRQRCWSWNVLVLSDSLHGGCKRGILIGELCNTFTMSHKLSPCRVPCRIAFPIFESGRQDCDLWLLLWLFADWWTWVWAGFRGWWYTGKPGVLQPMGSQRVGHNWVIELNWWLWFLNLFPWILTGLSN